jgi:hypothetical protein
MASRRYVKRNASGEWGILGEGHRRATTTAPSEKAALARARQQVRREGGGEVRVVDETGKIVRSSTVAGPRRARAA